MFERALLERCSPAGHRARLLTLTYHRIPRSRDPLLPDEADAESFAAQLDVLGYYCRILPLPEAVRRLREGTLPSRAVCITFDDGYENNLSVALPILEQRGMTATVFMAADAIDRGIMWNDLLIEAMRRAGASAGYREFGIAESPDPALPEAARIIRVLQQVRYEPLERRWEIAAAFYQKVAGGSMPRLMLTQSQVREINRRGHDVGAHTINHPILKGLGTEAAHREIAGSYAWVAEVTGRPPVSFAYPNGLPGRDYDESHAALAREAGFELAVSTRWGCATSRSNAYHLPRCSPWGVRSWTYPVRLARTYLLESD